ncbi:MAG: hypothetical protein QNJ47_20445 [Nostocaceae cyanobacterium]|nr:hypothetical protein [Nostocaceae cyanobacterium]
MQFINRDTNKRNILPLFLVGTFSLHLLTLLLLLFHGSMLQQVSKKFIPRSLVQLVDGRAITVDPTQNLERYDQTIRRFVGETMTLMFTWSEKQPPQTVWLTSSGLLSAKIRQQLESEIIDNPENPNRNNIRPGNESLLILQRISQPTKIEPGKWKLEIFANRLIFSRDNNLGKSITFNKQIFVHAIETPTISLPNTPLTWHLAAYRLGEARLEIYKICELEDKNCSEN